ncbi:hypothetical protein E2C01_000859 [Portunus trituberculatus]|uniref:Uncharacterized protein n=1 Tax=Portunus trituberculatus TaxID=210409 RepID=A0A5B7CG92_PORTR|nr:hypothetical protein [Portunus trituberculatus]
MLYLPSTVGNTWRHLVQAGGGGGGGAVAAGAPPLYFAFLVLPSPLSNPRRDLLLVLLATAARSPSNFLVCSILPAIDRFLP